MSDHDPIDRAYRDAEAMLEDDAARAARRARVLGAVVAQAPVAAARSKNIWMRPAAWLVAASVAGVSLVTAYQFSPPLNLGQPYAPERPVTLQPAPSGVLSAEPVAKGDAPAPPPSPTAPPLAPPPAPAPPPPAVFAEAPRVESLAVPVSPASPSPTADAAMGLAPAPVFAPPPPPRASAQARAAAPDQESRLESIVTTGGFQKADDTAERLRAAAAAGRLAELNALLADGAAVDAPDAKGETALMKAIQARRPAAAAALRRQGASLDLRTRAGLSARDMARTLNDPLLDEALGLAP